MAPRCQPHTGGPVPCTCARHPLLQLAWPLPGMGMLSPRWASAQGSVWASAWKTLCWRCPHTGAGSDFEGAAEHLGTHPSKDLAAGGAGVAELPKAAASWALAASTGLECTVSPPGMGSGAGPGCTAPLLRGVCVCTGVCVHGCTCPPTPVHVCVHGGVCLWVPVGTCGCAAGGCVCACERYHVCSACV